MNILIDFQNSGLTLATKTDVIVTPIAFVDADGNAQTHFFYACFNCWHIEPLMRLCYPSDWQIHIKKLTRVVFPLEALLNPPSELLDALDLAEMEFFDQGGFEKIAVELFEYDVVPVITARLDALSENITESIGHFFSELEQSYRGYMNIKTEIPVRWMLKHAQKLIKEHKNEMRQQTKRFRRQ